MAPNALSFQDLMRAHIGDMLDDVHTCKVASVVQYDPAQQRASVQPLIRRAYADPVTGERVTERLPVIDSVPIAFPRIGQWGMTFPIARGDVVLLVFSDASLDKWLQRGGEIDPGIDAKFDYNDAIAIPGVFDFAHVPTAVASDALVLHGPKIRIGSPSASSAIAFASDISVDVKDIVRSSTFINAVASFITSGALPAYQSAVDGLFAAKTWGSSKVFAE